MKSGRFLAWYLIFVWEIFGNVCGYFRRLLVIFIQKQPPRSVRRKRCSENMQQIYMRHPCRIAISIKLLCNFTEIILRHGCSSVNYAAYFQKTFSWEHSGWLLLFILTITTKIKLFIEVDYVQGSRHLIFNR